MIIVKKNKLRTVGRKPELKYRIEHYLKTGQAPNERQLQRSNAKKQPQVLPENINALIPENYTSSKLYRKYFQSIIGQHFHFTAYMMNFIKSHPGITFKEYVEEWQIEYERRKNKNYKPNIMKSCEYNQYIRDFFKHNSNYSLKDAIKCWKHKKSIIGNNKYCIEDLNVLKDNKTNTADPHSATLHSGG